MNGKKKQTSSVINFVLGMVFLSHVAYGQRERRENQESIGYLTYNNQVEIYVIGVPIESGSVYFTYSTRGGRPTVFELQVSNKWSEEYIATEIQTLFSGKLRTNAKVKTNGKKKVTITKNRKPWFRILFDPGDTNLSLKFDLD